MPLERKTELEKINECQDIEVLKFLCIGLLNANEAKDKHIKQLEDGIAKLNTYRMSDTCNSEKCNINYITQTLNELRGD